MIYPKGTEVRLSKSFTTADFDCKCKRPTCSTTTVNPVLVTCLETFLILAGKFAIDSGFRCRLHNHEVGGAEDSQHVKGNAADCRSLEGKTGVELATQAVLITDFRNGGIGTYFPFVHLDVRGVRARWKSLSTC